MPKSKFTRADDIFRGLLKQERKSQGLTQEELARRLGHPQSYVSKYELGERRLDFVETLYVCDALGIDFLDVAANFAARLGRSRRKKEA